LLSLLGREIAPRFLFSYFTFGVFFAFKGTAGGGAGAKAGIMSGNLSVFHVANLWGILALAAIAAKMGAERTEVEMKFRDTS
jgi:hypothetical protein